MKFLIAFIVASVCGFSAFAEADETPYLPTPLSTEEPPMGLSRGEYLVRTAGCMDCHSSTPDQPFAGGVELASPFGPFYTPNISPDPETGIGKWTRDDFRKALQEGISPSNAYYYPSFPYRAYSQMRVEDIDAMWEFLREQKPIYRVNTPHDLYWFVDIRNLIAGWRLLYFDRSYTPDASKGSEWNRGAYIAEAFSHCAECHTPRNPLTGGLDKDEWLNGGTIPFAGHLPPDITTDKVKGRGQWTRDDWGKFLASGRDPQGKYPAAEMAQVIRNTAGLTEADRQALITYLMSVKEAK